jgi:hypothetical protein
VTSDDHQNDVEAGGGSAEPVDVADEGSAERSESKGMGPFDPQRFYRELQIDGALRWVSGVLIVVAIIAAVGFDQSGSVVGLGLVMGLVFGWVWISSISTGVWRALPGVTASIGPDPSAAEQALAQLVRRRPLMRWVRLMLYLSLASIRHRQYRFAESAAICQAVLSQPLGPARRHRGRLLLMLAEAQIQCGNLWDAYLALSELHRQQLTLVESLQRIAIQTRYEVLAGHDHAALADVRQKLLLCELMPPIHCGAMHAMLTASAQRTGQHELADWLWRRSELLCGRETLARLVKSAFAVGIVGPPNPGSEPRG